MDIGSEANKRRSSFITYLGQWFRGRQTPEAIPVTPLNDPRHLPPPSQFVYLASATVHPRLAIPSIGRSNNCLIRLAAAFSPNSPRCKRAIPLRSRHFSPNPPTTDLVPTLFIATEKLCRAPLLQRDRFPRSTSVPAPSIATEAHLPHPTCRSPPRRVTTELPCSGLNRPSGGSNRPPPHGLVGSHFDKRWTPYHALFTATLARTISPIPGHQRYLPANFSVYPPACPGFPQPQQTRGLSIPTQLFSYPLINRTLATNGPSAFLDDTTTDDPCRFRFRDQ